MKKLLLSLALIGGVSFSSFADGDRETMKKEFIQECVTGFMESAGVGEEDAKTFCECSAEQVFKKFTDEELKAMSDPENMNEETQAKLMEASQPCIEDLMKKMGG